MEQHHFKESINFLSNAGLYSAFVHDHWDARVFQRATATVTRVCASASWICGLCSLFISPWDSCKTHFCALEFQYMHEMRFKWRLTCYQVSNLLCFTSESDILQLDFVYLFFWLNERESQRTLWMLPIKRSRASRRSD